MFQTRGRMFKMMLIYSALQIADNLKMKAHMGWCFEVNSENTIISS